MISWVKLTRFLFSQSDFIIRKNNFGGYYRASVEVSNYVSKLVYNLLTELYRGYNPFTKYQQDIPVVFDHLSPQERMSEPKKQQNTLDLLRWIINM